MKNSVQVEILGKEFTVKSENDESYVKEIADYVNRKMEEVLKDTRTVATVNVVLLAALNIADEYFRAKDQNQKLIGDIEEKCQELINLIEI
ncbi:MAG: cell division protein ZapA [Deltaproteobacteria bacterium]|nr:MAG: cell division protein ZapA [Deltaproteobacteria bacterium]